MDWVEKRRKVELLIRDDLIPCALEGLARRKELNGNLVRGVLIKGRRYSNVVFEGFIDDGRFSETSYEVLKNRCVCNTKEWYEVDVDNYLEIYLKD